MKPRSYGHDVDLGLSTWGQLDVLGPHHISTLARYWLSRCYAALVTFVLLLSSWLEPEALTHQLIDKSGGVGWWLVGAVCVVAVLGMLDVLVNDLLPARYCIRITKRRRHFIYFGLAIGNFAVSYVFLSESGGWFRAVVLPFWLNGTFAAFVAILDLFQRHRAPQ